MGDGAELDKTRTKFRFFKGTPRREAKIALFKNISAPKPEAPPSVGFKTGAAAGRYGGGIIIAPEYKPAAGVCRSPGSPGARDARPHPRHCVFPGRRCGIII